MRLDLYEQCSLHMTEKMPSSTRLGSRPMAFRTCSYSSALRPCCSTISGVISDMCRPLAPAPVRRQPEGHLAHVCKQGKKRKSLGVGARHGGRYESSRIYA